MWHRFSKNARKAVFHAQEEAQQWRTEFVSPEHLLLGIARMPECSAARMLSGHGATPDRLRDDIEARLAEVASTREHSGMTLSPEAKRVIDMAYDEARRLGHSFIGTEHLLLGILREGESTAVGVLKELGVTLKVARTDAMQLQGQETEPDAQATERLRGPLSPSRLRETTVPRTVGVVLACAVVFGVVGASVGFVFGKLAPAAVVSAFPFLGLVAGNGGEPSADAVRAEAVRTAVGAGMVNGLLVGVVVGILSVVADGWRKKKRLG